MDQDQTTQHHDPRTCESLLSSKMNVQRIVSSGVMAFCEIEKPADKTRVFQTLLKGQALSYFEYCLSRRIETEDTEIPDN
jgi:hypothetical protein